MNQLTKLYEAILRSMGLHVDDHGFVSMVLDDGPNPCMCDKKRLVVPNHEILRKANWNELIAFHPLSENIVRSESAVLIKTKRLIAYRLVRVMTEVLLTLMEIAVDKDRHKFLSPEQVRFLQIVPDVDQGTVKALLDVIDRCEVDTGERRLINIFQRRAAEIGKKNFQRGSIVTFPIVTDLQREEAEIFGVKMRVKDKQAIAALFNWVLPNADTFETYSAGSISMVAPFFDALMRAFINVANQLNKAIDLFSSIEEGLAGYRIDTSWVPELENLAKYRDLIPPLDGNQGTETIGSHDQRHQSAHLSSIARDMAGSPVPASLAPNVPVAPVAAPQPSYAAPAAPPPPPNPRAIVINDPNFKPLGGGQAINQQNPNQPPTAVKTPENDWGTYTEARMIQPQPQMPVFAAVGMPPPMPQAGYGMPPVGYGMPPAGYPMAPMPGYGAPPPGYGMPMQPGYPAPVAYGNMAVPGYTQYPAHPGQYQPQQPQTGLPVFAAVR